VLQERDELDLFRITLQQLEICRQLILDSTEAKSRVALILLDNISEIILYRVVKEELAREDFLRPVVRDQYPLKKRRAIDRFFWAKLEIVTDIRRLPRAVSAALTILHSYRNAAYHRDTHNPAVLPILARIAFVAVADLLARTSAGMQSYAIGGHRKPIEWLRQYGLDTTFVQFDTASKSIARQLTKGIRPKLSSVRQSFEADVASRIQAVQVTLHELFPSRDVQNIDRMLKWYEFLRVFPEVQSKLSAGLRALTYKIAAGRGEEVTRDEYLKAEAHFRLELSRRLAQFSPRCKFDDLHEIQQELLLLTSENNFRDALVRYADLDARLDCFEQSVTSGYHEMECQAELEEGIARGK
jgi:hypothetical protein